MTFDRTPRATWSTVTALVLTAGCSGSPMPLSPTALPGAGAPAGRFTLVRPSTVHATADLGDLQPGATTPTPGAPCTPLPTPGAPGTAPAGETPTVPTLPSSDGYGYYVLREGRVRAFDEPGTGAPGAALPCATVQITIAGSAGAAAFDPNPTPAQVGDQIVWANNDLRPHRIVIDDGTPTGLMVGDLLPGATSAPFSLTTPVVNYHCEFHPSMVGTINVPGAETVPGLPGTTVPAAPGANPTGPVDPGYPAPTTDYGYGY